jgi:NAD(P)-dependent dehydrogenase (short-subunit alcohol dehydrogenase family)
MRYYAPASAPRHSALQPKSCPRVPIPRVWQKWRRVAQSPMSEPAAPPPPLVWFLTGASSGLGRALAEAVLDAGHRLIATARQPAHLADLAAAHPGTCEILALDVTDPDQVRDTVAAAARVWGRLDVVVNNAGYGLLGAVEECSEDQIRKNFETNFFGPLHITQAALPILRAQRSGHLVFVSAAAAVANYAGFGIYGATKWAIEGLAESLRAETALLGLKVTVVEPGPFRTDFIRRSLERATTPIADYTNTAGRFAQFLAGVDGRQPGDPALAAPLIVSLIASGHAPFRLPLGRYMIDKLKRKAATTAKDAADWEATATSADFPAATAENSTGHQPTRGF